MWPRRAWVYAVVTCALVSANLMAGVASGAGPSGSPFAVDTMAIAYTTPGPNGHSSVGLVDADGSHQRVLSPSLSYVQWSQPDLSPDGSLIAVVQTSPVSQCASEIDVIRTDGTFVSQLGGGTSPRWSPDGSRIAYWSCGAPGLHVARPDGSGDLMLANGLEPSWSPDGSRIAYDDGTDIFTVPVTGGAPTRLTHMVPPAGALTPEWSPDGAHIAFKSPGGNGLNVATVMMMNTDGSAQTALFSTNYSATFSWAPDGHRLVTDAVNKSPTGLTIVGLDGTVQARLTVGQAIDPSWIRVPVSRVACSGGYRLASADGGVFAFGAAPFAGSAGSLRLNRQIVGMAVTPTGNGYWLVASDGGIFTFGDAVFYGSTGAIKLNRPVVGMAAIPDGSGYWLVASDGGIFTFGDARFRGSTGDLKLNAPVVGMAATSSGNGYWLVASDGGIFTFGDAVFYGSTGAIKLNQPIVGIAATADGGGYWQVAADGGIFTFGTAGFLGSGVGPLTTRPVVGITPTVSGAGYGLTDTAGGIFAFGDAVFCGTTAVARLNAPIVGLSR